MLGIKNVFHYGRSQGDYTGFLTRTYKNVADALYKFYLLLI